MIWSKQGDLHFQVYMKENQKLKYLNRGSTHTKDCFKAIQKGVQNRLGKLTTKTKANENQPLNKLYPDHFQALEKAILVQDPIPTLKEELERYEKSKDPKMRRYVTVQSWLVASLAKCEYRQPCRCTSLCSSITIE